MQNQAPLAFLADDGDIRINFGMFAGREATPAEIDDLARRLVEELEAVTIVAEHRYLVDRSGEASVHQIRIELDGRDAQPPLLLAEQWAAACIADRHVEVEVEDG